MANPSITVQPDLVLERILSIEIVRVTERAAVSAARLRGQGKDKASDQAAVDAMRRELNKLPIDGTVVIGEGERDEAPMLFIGEKVGVANKGKSGNYPAVDIAVDPLEGTNLCATGDNNAIAVLAAKVARTASGGGSPEEEAPGERREGRHAGRATIAPGLGSLQGAYRLFGPRVLSG